MVVEVPACDVCSALAGDEPRVLVSPYWKVTLSSDQGYLGRAFVSTSRHVASLSDLSTDEWTDLREVISVYEAAVSAAFGAVLFNWGCLMNNTFQATEPNPHVHWHVRPRYDQSVTIDGHTYADPDFAHHYDSSYRDIRSRSIIEALTDRIQGQINVN